MPPATAKPKRIELIELRLGDITDLHHCLAQLEDDLSLPSFCTPRQASFTSAGLLNLLNNLPISVVATNKSYRCVGNIRLYRLATKLLPPDTMVPVIVIKNRCSKHEIITRYLAELFLLPAAHHISRLDVGILLSSWEYMHNDGKKFTNPLQCKSKKEFSKTYRTHNSTPITTIAPAKNETPKP